MTLSRITPGPLAVAYEQARARLEQTSFADALWSRRLDVWTTDTQTQRAIANRLGWLSAIDFVAPNLARLTALSEWIRGAGFTDVVLLGMGGSSLAPEVLRQVLGVAPGYPRFRMLDSVDPEAVDAALANAATSLFVLASKSGSTIEPNVMTVEARRRLIAAGEAQWASRFIAVTDENTALHRRAGDEGFRELFVNPSDIGGRYSALSYFGMVPAALMGADVGRLLERAREMESACRLPNVADNPGLSLGALMAAGAGTGRDKLTLLLPKRLESLGLWIEQLVAESTGKHGKGVVPIAGEIPDAHLGDDRIVVAVGLAGESVDERVARAREAGLPIAELEMADAESIGAEFLRWEIATAAAGMLMEINPFDEPNVQQAKDATRTLLDSYARDRRLSMPEPHGAVNGARLTLSNAAVDALSGAPATEFLQLLRPPDYFALLAYLPPEVARYEQVLDEWRAEVARQSGCATMSGYGPRYLHSTGQLHKGGANNGVFIVLTAPAPMDLPIETEPFSFSVLEMAQAVGDFLSLDRTGRRALHVHLPDRDPESIRRAGAALLATIIAEPRRR